MIKIQGEIRSDRPVHRVPTTIKPHLSSYTHTHFMHHKNNTIDYAYPKGTIMINITVCEITSYNKEEECSCIVAMIYSTKMLSLHFFTISVIAIIVIFASNGFYNNFYLLLLLIFYLDD